MKNIKKQIEEITGETIEDMGLQEEVEDTGYWELGEQDEDFDEMEKEEKREQEEIED